MYQRERDSIAFFTRMSRTAKRCIDAALANQPKCHYGVLHRLAVAIETCGRDGGINVSELASTLYDTPQAVSRCLRMLEQEGLVERCTDPEDRRKTVVRLTPAGQQAHDACAEAMDAFGTAVTGVLGEERLRRMGEDLNEMLSAMEAEAERLEAIQKMSKEVEYD